MKSPEVTKNDVRRIMDGFYSLFMRGQGCEIHYHSEFRNWEPVIPSITKTLIINKEEDFPVENNSFDFVFSSHFLEHVKDYNLMIREMYRITKFGGNIVIIVPHSYLYEKKATPPSLWNLGHHRFYTPKSLIGEIQGALKPNSYRLVYLADNDDCFDYKLEPDKHSFGSFEIECVIKKIEKPTWDVK